MTKPNLSLKREGEVAHRRQVDKVLRFPCDLCPERCPIIRTEWV